MNRPQSFCHGLWLKKVPNEFANKVFGDTGHALADKFLESVGERVQPPAYRAIEPGKSPAPQMPIKFANSLFRQVDRQRTQAGTAIINIAETINKSVTFGGALVKLLVQKNPRFNLLDYKAQKLAGYKVINEMLYAVRQTWANKWLFYGCDPPTLTKSGWDLVITDLERQMWLVWIVQQKFHLGMNTDLGGDGPIAIVGASGAVLSRTGLLSKERQRHCHPPF